MRFFSIYTPNQAGPPSEEMMAEMGKLVEESMKSGELVATGGLMPVTIGGVRIRRSGDQISVMDGPFTESKEMIAGFAILEAKSREEAIEMTRKFLKVAGDGECELRQMMGPEDQTCVS